MTYLSPREQSNSEFCWNRFFRTEKKMRRRLFSNRKKKCAGGFLNASRSDLICLYPAPEPLKRITERILWPSDFFEMKRGRKCGWTAARVESTPPSFVGRQARSGAQRCDRTYFIRYQLNSTFANCAICWSYFLAYLRGFLKFVSSRDPSWATAQSRIFFAQKGLSKFLHTDHARLFVQATCIRCPVRPRYI